MAEATQAASESGEQLADGLLADFSGRIEALRREGVPTFPPLGGRTPWAETPEAEKLQALVWESETVWLGADSSDPGGDSLRVVAIPGISALEMVERHVDYTGLPAVQREMLQGLRAQVDAGQFAGPQPDGKDRVGMALARVVGSLQFEQMIEGARDSDALPWDGKTETEKLRLLVDLAQEAGPPGAYVVAVIGREVDAERLPPWRRDMLEELRERLDAGLLAGENPNPTFQDDRALTALRLTELECRIEDDRRSGVLTGDGRHWPWQRLTEFTKFDHIMAEIDELHLASESAAYHLLYREVDLKAVSNDQWWAFEEGRQKAWPEPSADMRELFKEWEEDYGLRREEDANHRLAQPVSGTAQESRPPAGLPHPWPSEIAKANRQKQAGPEEGKSNGKTNGHDTGAEHSI